MERAISVKKTERENAISREVVFDNTPKNIINAVVAALKEDATITFCDTASCDSSYRKKYPELSQFLLSKFYEEIKIISEEPSKIHNFLHKLKLFC